ncbi:Uncharacterised protein [Anaerobiospirillum thomasii]|uniref:DUF4241 domain-containing protein n=1 Tax=Anaerobiospirillum thomasii TaxID=179995 RepID=A0A2X0VB29_9GAMM|nr:DUF4241 domain-containing protein [Anaerobiospirillum thomasii]SPT70015.1 Uncharacterised protein [Anaerobiospirillum thomasii]SPT71344.1 Uncharacterised protein [Anaerobiospirillum thomasii]
MADSEWLAKYETFKVKLRSQTDLESYFISDVIEDIKIDVIDAGSLYLPTGTVIACDPLVNLDTAEPFLQTVEAGTYPVKLCVVPSEKYGDRYACIKIEISQEKPVVYELAMTGSEQLDEEPSQGEYFGFGVDAGMGCIADIQTQKAFKAYWDRRLEEDSDIDPYNDLFEDLLEQNVKENPKYQSRYGDWLNWTVPDSSFNLIMCSSGWGDGCYPVYFGYDGNGKVCGIYVSFIDIKESYS